MQNRYLKMRTRPDKPKPNYGASSDLLRYKILFCFGGAYFDFDITPGTTSLENSNIFNKTYKYHCLYVHNKSQNTDKIGNDAFICTPGNPYMQKMYETAINHYTLRIDSSANNVPGPLVHMSSFNSPDVLTYCNEYHNWISESTLYRTGPVVTRLAIGDEKPIEKEEEITCCNLILDQKKHPIVSHMSALTNPFERNGGTWKKDKKLIELESEKFIARIASTIKFEVEKFKILRLDDHVKKLIELAGYNETEASQCIVRLLNDLGISCYQLTCIQLTFLYKKTVDFCHVNKLMDKTFLFPLSEACQEMVDTQPYYTDAVRQVMSVNQYNDIKEQITEGTYKNRKEGSFTKNSALSSREFLNYALDFCNFLFEDTNSELNKSLFDYLDYLIDIFENDIIYQLGEICKATNSENFDILRAGLIENKEKVVAFTKEKKLLVNSENKSQSKVTVTMSPYNLFYIKSGERNNISKNDEKYGKNEVTYLPQQRSNIP